MRQNKEKTLGQKYAEVSRFIRKVLPRLKEPYFGCIMWYETEKGCILLEVKKRFGHKLFLEGDNGIAYDYDEQLIKSCNIIGKKTNS